MNTIKGYWARQNPSIIAKSVTDLMNLTFSTSVPSQWKEARVTSSYKTGMKDDENNHVYFQFSPWSPK